MSNEPPEVSSSPVTYASQPPEGMANPADVEQNRVFAVLAYIGLLWLVPLLAAKESPFARFHTNQGIVLFLTFFVAMSVCGIFMIIPFVGCLLIPVFLLLLVGHVVLMVLGIVNAAQGRLKPLPVIGGWKLLT
jgi:uncharacterized membrane protein